jgi:PAS domain-containing protein
VRSAFELVDDAVIVLAPDDGDRVVFVNAAFERVSKIRRDEATGRILDSLLRPRSIAGAPDVLATRDAARRR